MRLAQPAAVLQPPLLLLCKKPGPPRYLLPCPPVPDASDAVCVLQGEEPWRATDMAGAVETFRACFLDALQVGGCTVGGAPCCCGLPPAHGSVGGDSDGPATPPC